MRPKIPYKETSSIINEMNSLNQYYPVNIDETVYLANQVGYLLQYVRTEGPSLVNNYLDLINRVEWKYYNDNIIHLASFIYDGCSNGSTNYEIMDKYVLKDTDLGKLITIGYALLMDVLPERRKNLQARLEWWLHEKLPEETSFFTVSVLNKFNLPTEHISMLVQMIQLLDENETRKASVCFNVLHPSITNTLENNIDNLFSPS